MLYGRLVHVGETYQILDSEMHKMCLPARLCPDPLAAIRWEAGKDVNGRQGWKAGGKGLRG